MKSGIYEQILSREIQQKLEGIPDSLVKTDKLDEGDSHHVLAQYLTQTIATTLASLKGDNKLQRQKDLVNRVLGQLAESINDEDVLEKQIIDPAQQLLAIKDCHLPAKAKVPERPVTPLSTSALLTGSASGDPSMESQLKQEIIHADEVDILCSFIKWSGIVTIKEELEQFTQKGGRLRIITTSYMGATDLHAIDYLERLPNTEVKVTYDTSRTRLHAKAYIFKRGSQFGTAYIGSANISRPALTSGLEWNVKISQYESPHLWAKITGAFEAYANDHEFEIYDESKKPKLEKALRKESGQGSDKSGINFFVDLTPYDYQSKILHELDAERMIHKSYRNLIVAATGTGKTMISAFDYLRFRRLQQDRHESSRLLFVAHRKEILEQSRACFRHALRDANFGDLLVGGHQPDQYDHLFVSIQSHNSKGLWDQLPADYYDFIIVDEFHHAAAPSYQKLLDYFEPKILLGLTATPERADGQSVLPYFDNRIAAEIRLPDAINRKLLSPFQYFGITDHDSVDYNKISWSRGGYDAAQLNELLTGNDARVMLILDKMQELLLAPKESRGLCFCVSKEHARYMARKFNEAGLKAEALTSESETELRSLVKDRLVKRDLNFICVVDLYNEGVDIPEVDTILFLRPTESLTVFLQQLGRGLRLHDDKDSLTVLDFVGHCRNEFNYESRFRALLGASAKGIDQEIEDSFPHLPAGCSINLERVAKEHIFKNIKQAISHTNKRKLVDRIRSFENSFTQNLSLLNFVKQYRLDLTKLYKFGTWSRLSQMAGVRDDFECPDELRLTKGFRRLCHISSASQINDLLELLTMADWQGLSIRQNRLLAMLGLSLFNGDKEILNNTDLFGRIESNRILKDELIDLLKLRYEELSHVCPKLNLPFDCALELHGQYTRDEVLAGLGYWTLESQPSMREGVKYLQSINADVFFVTLDKCEKHYSPTTMYEDYAINNELFHWQSQSTTSEMSKTGQRYINHRKNGGHILLFTRDMKNKESLAQPYTFLGTAQYVSHEGNKPMSITWKLDNKMPEEVLQKAAKFANG